MINQPYFLQLAIVCIAALSVAVYYVFEIPKEVKLRQIKNESDKLLRGDEGKKGKEKKESKFKIALGDTEKIRIMLARAGNPLPKFGLDENNYMLYKTILGILSGYSASEDGWLWIVIYFFMGFFMLDIYIRLKKKKRHREIKAVLDRFITTTIEGLQMGQLPNEIFDTALKKLPSENPLYTELAIVKSKIVSLNGNLKTALNEFRNRIDMEEIDNYCFSLLQYDIGGRAVTMLKMQLDLIQTIKANNKKRETSAKSNLSSVAVALLVVALLLIIMMPLMIKIKELPIGK